MAKCQAVAVSRQPHTDIVGPDGVEYTAPIELWRDVGQHNVDSGALVECFPKALLAPAEGFMVDYGVGERLHGMPKHARLLKS